MPYSIEQSLNNIQVRVNKRIEVLKARRITLQEEKLEIASRIEKLTEELAFQWAVEASINDAVSMYEEARSG